MGTVIGCLFMFFLFLAFVPVWVLGLYVMYKLTGGRLGFVRWCKAMEF